MREAGRKYMTAEQKRQAAARKDAAALRNIPRMAYWHMAHRPYWVKGGESGDGKGTFTDRKE